jgi:primosomal protein N' (replication factor Y)
MAAIGGQARVMIGPRSVIFAPIHDAGLIVVDEEHDASYKNEEGIRYHARDLAVALAGYSKCPIVLGSATPSSESFANTRRGRYRLLRLLRRVNDRAMATVEIVDMRREVAEARKSAEAAYRWSGKSETKPQAAEVPGCARCRAVGSGLRENLGVRRPGMVFLNRRGFTICNAICGNVIACPNCSVSMTFHCAIDRSLPLLRNHTAPDFVQMQRFRVQGQGFARQLWAAAAMMPNAHRKNGLGYQRTSRRARGYSRASRRRNRYSGRHPMITKGFDFPGVTLAAVSMPILR